MINLKNVVHLRRKLIKINIFFMITGLLILSVATISYIQINSKVGELKKNYGSSIEMLDDVKLQMTEANGQLTEVSRKLDRNIQTQKNIYFDKIASYICGGYGTYGMKNNKLEREDIRKTVELYFESAVVMHRKGMIKLYSHTPRQTAIRALGEARKETDFNSMCVNQNYVRDTTSRYVVLFNPDDKYAIEDLGRLKSESFDYVLGRQATFVSEETGNKKRAAPIGISDKIVVETKDLATITIGKQKKKIRICDYAIKTTKDYGKLQVNEINLTKAFAALKRNGLWNEAMDRWAQDDQINFYLRMYVNEDSTRAGRDMRGAGHWDETLVNGLEKIDGWQGIYE